MKKNLFLPILFISTLSYAKETNPMDKKYQEVNKQEVNKPRVSCKKRLLNTRTILSIEEDNRNDLAYVNNGYFKYLEGEGLEKWGFPFSSPECTASMKTLPVKKANR